MIFYLKPHYFGIVIYKAVVMPILKISKKVLKNNVICFAVFFYKNIRRDNNVIK